MYLLLFLMYSVWTFKPIKWIHVTVQDRYWLFFFTVVGDGTQM